MNVVVCAFPAVPVWDGRDVGGASHDDLRTNENKSYHCSAKEAVWLEWPKRGRQVISPCTCIVSRPDRGNAHT